MDQGQTGANSVPVNSNRELTMSYFRIIIKNMSRILRKHHEKINRKYYNNNQIET